MTPTPKPSDRWLSVKPSGWWSIITCSIGPVILPEKVQTAVVPARKKCRWGKRGCLETYFLATDIVRIFLKLPAARWIFELALRADIIALEAFVIGQQGFWGRNLPIASATATRKQSSLRVIWSLPVIFCCWSPRVNMLMPSGQTIG